MSKLCKIAYIGLPDTLRYKQISVYYWDPNINMNKLNKFRCTNDMGNIL